MTPRNPLGLTIAEWMAGAGISHPVSVVLDYLGRCEAEVGQGNFDGNLALDDLERVILQIRDTFNQMSGHNR